MTIVVKLGSSLVADGHGRVRRSLLSARAREIGELVGRGEQVIVVSSGAIALGLDRLGLERRPRALPRLQAASALGQVRLQQAWVNVRYRNVRDKAKHDEKRAREEQLLPDVLLLQRVDDRLKQPRTVRGLLSASCQRHCFPRPSSLRLPSSLPEQPPRPLLRQ